MKTTIKVDGLADLDVALGELTKAAAKGVLTRVLRKAGAPIADAASANARKATGELSASIVVSSRLKNPVGNAEFAAAMRAGLGKAAAVSALRDARRAADGGGSFAEMHVGPSSATSKKDAIKRIVEEFGSVKSAGHPYMRPAWDAQKNAALEIIKTELGGAIAKAVARRAKKLARQGS